jgi:hypothetical protein
MQDIQSSRTSSDILSVFIPLLQEGYAESFAFALSQLHADFQAIPCVGGLNLPRLTPTTCKRWNDEFVEKTHSS